MRDGARSSARRNAQTDAATHRDYRGLSSKLSRLPRFGLFVKQTRRNASFIVAPPCQSEIKRTLRRAGRHSKTAFCRGFRMPRKVHSMQMVNAGFPERTGYGFEMVDAPERTDSPAIPASIKNLRRIKSIWFSSNFPRFKPNANTCDLSTPVSPDPIAGSTAREQ